MRNVLSALLLAAITACGAAQENSAAAQPHQAHNRAVEIHGGFAAPTPGGVDVSAGYLTISNHTAHDERLLAVSSPRAARVEAHEMSMDNGVMRMRPVDSLVVPANGEIVLAPGGAHLMFYGVREPFVQGQTVAVRLRFERAGEIDVVLPVQRAATGHSH